MAHVLVPDDFRGLATPLEVEVDGGPALPLAVETLKELRPHRLREAPFSMILTGPREPLLPQATYALAHPRLGRIELFLVPIGQDARSTRYEVTFN